MFLAIDVGNTQSTLGLFDDEGGLVRGWRMSTNASDTSDMLHSRLWGYFMKDGLSLSDVTAAGVATVVPALERAWRRCLATHLGEEPLVVSAGATMAWRSRCPSRARWAPTASQTRSPRAGPTGRP